MKSIMRKAAAYGLVLAMGCTSLAGCGKNGAKIDGRERRRPEDGCSQLLHEIPAGSDVSVLFDVFWIRRFDL